MNRDSETHLPNMSVTRWAAAQTPRLDTARGDGRGAEQAKRMHDVHNGTELPSGLRCRPSHLCAAVVRPSGHGDHRGPQRRLAHQFGRPVEPLPVWGPPPARDDAV